MDFVVPLVSGTHTPLTMFWKIILWRLNLTKLMMIFGILSISLHLEYEPWASNFVENYRDIVR